MTIEIIYQVVRDVNNYADKTRSFLTYYDAISYAKKHKGCKMLTFAVKMQNLMFSETIE